MKSKEAGNIILFFDEIHQILGAGSTGDGQGSKGLADILKPALSRGELTVIGATTQDEYRNTILKNAALARRFNEVKVMLLLLKILSRFSKVFVIFMKNTTMLSCQMMF